MHDLSRILEDLVGFLHNILYVLSYLGQEPALQYSFRILDRIPAISVDVAQNPPW